MFDTNEREQVRLSTAYNKTREGLLKYNTCIYLHGIQYMVLTYKVA